MVLLDFPKRAPTQDSHAAIPGENTEPADPGAANAGLTESLEEQGDGSAASFSRAQLLPLFSHPPPGPALTLPWEPPLSCTHCLTPQKFLIQVL